MVLPSQIGRAAGSRSFVTGRRRRRGLRRWIVLVVLLAAAYGLYHWLGSGDSSPDGIDVEQAAAQSDDNVQQAGITDQNNLAQLASEVPIQSSGGVEEPIVIAEPPAVEPQPESEYTPPISRRDKPVDPFEDLLSDVKDQTTETIEQPHELAGGADTTQEETEGAAEQDVRVVDQPDASAEKVEIPDNPDVTAQMDRGMALIREGKKVEGRRILSKLLLDPAQPLKAQDADWVRKTLTDLADKMIFAREQAPNDPLSEIYTFMDGDYLSTIAPRYRITYQLIEKINNVKATRMWAGRKIKVIRGPFHAVVDKSAYRMDVYLVEKPGNTKVFIASYAVGLGENDSTPPGLWVVRRGSKVSNPSWRNPRTMEVYNADDPDNPIGEYWIGLEGADANTTNKAGYGIHGTNEPQSIGRQASMGCIRMRETDLAIFYDLMHEGYSTVEVRE